MPAKKKAVAEAEAEEKETMEESEAMEKAEAPVKAENKYSIANLAKNSRELFGVSSCTFAGATAGLTGEYTVNEMNSIIKTWCGKEIM